MKKPRPMTARATSRATVRRRTLVSRKLAEPRSRVSFAGVLVPLRRHQLHAPDRTVGVQWAIEPYERRDRIARHPVMKRGRLLAGDRRDGAERAAEFRFRDIPRRLARESLNVDRFFAARR